MDHLELQVSCNAEFLEILIAEIGDLGFESMMETDEGFNAYIGQRLFDETLLIPLLDKYGSAADFGYKSQIVKKVNWNKKWEKNFEPVVIQGECAIRASFHDPIPEVKYEIIIDPKMSFGTGHHATTSLMVGFQLGIDHRGKRILDCGCGTGILSILAAKLKGESVIGFDIDEWAVENADENSKTNGVLQNTYMQGTIQELDITGKFDIILANINKNILLEEIPEYSHYLDQSGQLILSGFYINDLADIISKAEINGLKFERSEERNEWTAAIFIKDQEHLLGE